MVLRPAKPGAPYQNYAKILELRSQRPVECGDPATWNDETEMSPGESSVYEQNFWFGFVESTLG